MNKKWRKGLVLGGALLFLLWVSPLLIPLHIEKVREWPTSPILLDEKLRPFFVSLSSSSEWCIPI
ncbi:MAG: hypothetical protein PHO50_08420, partial [Aminobacterium colombiense]|nr:hypothetical protein [Aminobacterium colombiense]